jgi:mono/diheme cytochrome c family protein
MLKRISSLVTALMRMFGSVTAAIGAQSEPDERILMERGRYLVLAANCISCHTTKSGKPFAGGNALQTPYRFLGDVYSSNITPDLQTGVGVWTEEDFMRAMRRGVTASWRASVRADTR